MSAQPNTPPPRRPLGTTGMEVTPVAMGCWPITGITSLGVTEDASLATLQAAFEAGINFFDTAYMYGKAGESERMIARALGDHRDEIVIATKGGWHWKEDGTHARDGRPEVIRRHCEESLQRLNTDVIDLYYLHAPDADVPVADSAGAIRELLDAGKIRAAGASNCDVAQLEEFATVCPISAIQPHYNMLQREIEDDILPWCVARDISVFVYWPLMKGLLAGHLPRNHQFASRDGRQKYPMFQGEEWEKNQDFLDRLRPIAAETGHTLPQVVINWTIHRSGITGALCGAKRPEQIRDTAAAMGWQLTEDQTTRIDQAIADRGPIISRSAAS